MLGDRSENAEYIWGNKRLREIECGLDRDACLVSGVGDLVICVRPGGDDDQEDGWPEDHQWWRRDPGDSLAAKRR